MSDTIIEDLYNRNKEAIDYLAKKKELTFLVQIKDNFSKIFILSIGSYFEFRISEIILEFAKHKSNDNLIWNFIT